MDNTNDQVSVNGVQKLLSERDSDYSCDSGFVSCIGALLSERDNANSHRELRIRELKEPGTAHHWARSKPGKLLSALSPRVRSSSWITPAIGICEWRSEAPE